MKYSNSNNSRNMSLFFSGLGAGVAIALLLAPKSGEQTRTHLRETLLDVKDKAIEHQNGLRDTLKQTRDQLSAAVDAGREAYRKTATRASNEIGEVYDDAVSSM